MNIAFDAKRAFTNGTGLGHYSRTLIRSLAEYYPEHEYFLCTPKLTGRFNTGTLNNVHVVTPHHFPSTLFTAAWRSKWVKKDLKHLGIQLYHGLSHEIPIGIQHTGARTAVTIHDLIFERYPGQYSKIDVQIYRKKFQYACRNASRIIAISKQTKEDIIEFYKIPPHKIDVCYQSCNPAFSIPVLQEEKLRIKQLYNLPAEYFLYVGSVIERKNLLTVCKALNLLKNKTGIPLVVIGDGGKYLQQVKQYVQQHNLNKQVIFLADDPSVNQLPSFKFAVDFPAIYQQAVCMIYPSIFEGFGIPVLEALCSRIPVITSNVSCLPEAGGPGALYINPHDEEEMAGAMQKIASDSGLRKGLAEKGWQYAQLFTPQKCAEAVMNVYTEIMRDA
jgi:glycosyltransferase involved in cell wall biosynthesis